MTEEKKEYNKKYYQKNKLRIKLKSKKYYKNNKKDMNDYNSKYREEHREYFREYSSKYYSENKEKISDYYKNTYRIKKIKNHKDKLNNFKKTNKLKKIVPTEEELKLMEVAIKGYSNKNKRYITREEVLGDAYECLLIAINSCDREKDRNKYIIQKTIFGLIDKYRNRNKTRSKNKIYPTSLDKKVIHTDGVEQSLSDIIPANDYTTDTTERSIDSNYFQKYIKKRFNDLEKVGKNFTGEILYEIFVLRNLHGWTLQKIGDKYGKSEGRVSQIFIKYINPHFELIRKEIIKANPSWF